MKIIKLSGLAILLFSTYSCVPFDKIYSHEFNSGYFKLKSYGSKPEKIYLNLTEDSLFVYPVIKNNKSVISDTAGIRADKISSVSPGSDFYQSTFIKTSADVDLSTVIVKYRPAVANVQSQLNSNVNAILYAGFRKDFFRIKSHTSPIRDLNTFIRHTGFDFGFFAGIGITPVNPTVTMNRTTQEYDGIVFQKGISVFGTFENMSIGIALGFDNLLDNNKNIWIYNQKPWIGIVLGIANF
jgi:hypothetical protein